MARGSLLSSWRKGAHRPESCAPEGDVRKSAEVMAMDALVEVMDSTDPPRKPWRRISPKAPPAVETSEESVDLPQAVDDGADASRIEGELDVAVVDIPDVEVPEESAATAPDGVVAIELEPPPTVEADVEHISEEQPSVAAVSSVGAVSSVDQQDVDEPGDVDTRSLSMRGAAAACGVTQAAMRTRLAAGEFPNAARLPSGEWRIPVEDLRAAGLSPSGEAGAEVVSANFIVEAPVDEKPAPLIAAAYARLRAEFAEAYATVQAERLVAEAEKWQLLAEERDRSLQRADDALLAVTIAVESAAVIARAAAGALDALDDAPPPRQVARFGVGATPPSSSVVAVPSDIRDEARRFAEALHGSHGMPKRRRLF